MGTNYPPSSRRSFSSRDFKRWAFGFLKFATTVVLSAVLSLFLQSYYRKHQKEVAQIKAKNDQDKAAVVKKQPAESALSKMETLYRNNLEEIFSSLRARPEVRMVKLVLPSRLLNLQREIASVRDGTSYRLKAKQDQIPVMAVSLEAMRLLDQMLVVYIQPKQIDKKELQGVQLPFPAKQLRNYVLVPDMTGENAFLYTLERK